MSRAIRLLIAASAGALASGCGTDLVSPRREGSLALARAVDAPSLSAWPVSASSTAIGWNNNARNETGWEVFRSLGGATGTFERLDGLAANSTGFSHTGLAAFTEVCYQVRFFRITGAKTSFAAFSNTACATTFGPPADPSNADATPQSYYIAVRWNDNSTDETGFRVDTSASLGGPWESAASVSANVTTYSQNHIAEAAQCYRIVAIGAYGQSGPSNADCTIIPAAPSNLAGSRPDATTIDLTWTDNSAAEESFDLYRMDETVGAWTLHATLPEDAVAYRDAGLVTHRRYWYYLVPRRDGGSGQQSGTISLVAADLSVPPPQPVIDVVPVGSTAVTAWVAYAIWDVTNGVRFERSTDGGASWTSVPGDWGVTEAGLVSDAQICYRGTAYNERGTSPVSDMACTAPPKAPSNVAMTTAEDDNLLFTWTDNSAVEDGYAVLAIYYYEDGYVEQYEVGWADANSSSMLVFNYYLYGYDMQLVALKDGGYSDFGTFGSSATIASARTRAGLRAPTLTARKPGIRAPRLGMKQAYQTVPITLGPPR